MNYVTIIRRLDKLQKAEDHLRRMDDGENYELGELRLKIAEKIAALRGLVDEYLREPNWTFTGVNGLVDAKECQIETAMRLLGVSRRTMGWR